MPLVEVNDNKSDIKDKINTFMKYLNIMSLYLKTEFKYFVGLRLSCL